MFGTRSGDGYHELIEGIRAKTLVYGEKTLLTEFLLDKGARLPEHSHANEQAGYLVKGRVILFVGNRAKTMNPGDSWCVPSNAGHRVEVLEDSVAVEVFSPCREEYLKYVNNADVER